VKDRRERKVEWGEKEDMYIRWNRISENAHRNSNAICQFCQAVFLPLDVSWGTHPLRGSANSQSNSDYIP